MAFKQRLKHNRIVLLAEQTVLGKELIVTICTFLLSEKKCPLSNTPQSSK
jgi:hypothetical protein